jgi:hypothetical protein
MPIVARADALCGSSKKEQRDYGHRTCAEQQRELACIACGDRMLERHRQQQVADGEGHDRQDLDAEADDRCGLAGFLDEAIEPEARRQCHSNPGQLAVVEGPQRHAEDHERDGQALACAQAFAKEDCAEHDVDERRDVVAEARIQEALCCDSVDEREPIDAQEGAGCEEPE